MTDVTAPDRYARLQPRNWPLPIKLASVLLVPTLLGLVLGGLRIADRTQDADALAALDRYVTLRDKASSVITALQKERDLAAVFVQNNRVGDPGVVRDSAAATDTALTDLSNEAGDPESMAGAPATAYRQAKENLNLLDPLRGQVAGGGVEAPAVIARYTGLIEPMTVFATSLGRQLATPALAGMAAALGELDVAREQVALQHSVIAVAIARSEMLPADADAVRATDARLNSSIDQLRASLDADQQARFAGFATDQANGDRQRLKQAALSRVGARGQLGVGAAEWDGAVNSVLAEMRTSETALRDDIRATSAAQQEAQHNAAGIDSVILLLTMLAAATVVYLIGKSMLKPLRLLRRTALDVAERRLPKAVEGMRAGEMPNVNIKPVPVTSTEEIGQVARAFDEVHGQAVRLAAEQATLQTSVSGMFVNLSRRSQSLVERQLQLIERLERNEQDAEQLDNLFQLDHLATRMRRNSENLLVLAGSDLAKRGGAPVPVVDVLRAAVSEIEQYQRVVVQQPPNAQVQGRGASDLVHLVAELLDNATSFSPPDSPVVVSSWLLDDGSVRVEIADRGMGMAGEELISANNRLAGPTTVDVSASRRMGLFVVGRLAHRHGVGVQLASTTADRSGVGGGVTATVTVPSSMVTAGRPGAATVAAETVRVAERTALVGAAVGSRNGAHRDHDGPATMLPEAIGADNGRPDGLGSDASETVWADPSVAGPARVDSARPDAAWTEAVRADSGWADMVPPENGQPDQGPADTDGAAPLPRRVPRGAVPPLPRRTAGAALAGRDETPLAAQQSQPPQQSPQQSPSQLPSRRPEQPRQQPPPGGEHRHGPAHPRSAGSPPPVPPPPVPPPPPLDTPDRERDDNSPIFEQMASAWFRDNWQTPGGGADQGGPAGGNAEAGGADSVWGGDADWNSADPLLRPMPEQPAEEVTSAGLPKRRPKSHLFPGGGEDSGGGGPAPAAPVPARTAEQIRGRLASYQRGVRQGRHARQHQPSEDSGGTGDGRHVEQGQWEENT